MAPDSIVGEAADLSHVLLGGKKLECAHTQMTGGNTRQHCAGFGPVAHDPFARCDHRKGTACWNTQSMHRLTHEIFTQHRAKHGLAIALAGERRAARSLELNVAALTVAVDHLADKQGAAVTELRRKSAELVAGIDLRQW